MIYYVYTNNVCGIHHEFLPFTGRPSIASNRSNFLGTSKRLLFEVLTSTAMLVDFKCLNVGIAGAYFTLIEMYQKHHNLLWYPLTNHLQSKAKAFQIVWTHWFWFQGAVRISHCQDAYFLQLVGRVQHLLQLSCNMQVHIFFTIPSQVSKSTKMVRWNSTCCSFATKLRKSRLWIPIAMLDWAIISCPFHQILLKQN